MSGQSDSGVPTRIVVGTDGSATAERAVAKASARAKAEVVASASYQAVAGDPSEALIHVTREQGADLLVVGSEGMQSTARFLLGPIADKVSRKVDRDLLIVETSEH
jgi:nucleotide-binding universal stress UspA family protein